MVKRDGEYRPPKAWEEDSNSSESDDGPLVSDRGPPELRQRAPAARKSPSTAKPKAKSSQPRSTSRIRKASQSPPPSKAKASKFFLLILYLLYILAIVSVVSFYMWHERVYLVSAGVTSTWALVETVKFSSHHNKRV